MWVGVLGLGERLGLVNVITDGSPALPDMNKLNPPPHTHTHSQHTP